MDGKQILSYPHAITFLLLLFSALHIPYARASNLSLDNYYIQQLTYDGRVNANSTQTITGIVCKQGTSDPSPNGTWVYVLQNSTILSLAMDEGAGTTAHDWSGKNNHGKIIGASWTTGKFGKALSFNASARNYVNMSDVLDFGASDDFSLEVWIKIPYQPSPSRLLISKWDRSAHYFLVVSGLGIRFQIKGVDSTNVAATDFYTIEADTWVHLVGVRDAGNKIYLFVNGVLKGEVNDTTAGTLENDGDLVIGTHSDVDKIDRYSTGIIDEVRIYNRALSSSEIKQHYLSTMSTCTNSNGHFSISNFYSPEAIGKYQYIIASQNNVGNKTFDVISDRILVSSYGNDDDRRDIGTEGTVWFKLHSEYDHESVTSGSVILNGSYNMAWDSSKTRWEYKVTQTSVGQKMYYVEYANWDKYGITLLNPSVTSNTATIIWDTVVVTLNIADARINVGDNVTITINKSYAYDNSTLDGMVTLNSTIWTYDTVGRRGYTTQSISDPTYGLTTFTSNSVYCIWDRINVNWTAAKKVYVNWTVTITVSLWREYDATRLTDYTFNVSRNGTAFQNTHTTNTFTDVCSSTGTWTYELTSVTDNTYGLTSFVAPPNLTIQWGMPESGDYPTAEIPARTSTLVATLFAVAFIVLVTLILVKRHRKIERGLKRSTGLLERLKRLALKITLVTLTSAKLLRLESFFGY